MLLNKGAWISKFATSKILLNCQVIVIGKTAGFATLPVVPKVDVAHNKCMSSRWIHSTVETRAEHTTKVNPITSETIPDGKHATSESGDPGVQLENAYHFRESKSKQYQGTRQKNEHGGLSMVDSAMHEDIMEAKGMHEGGYRLPHPIWSENELDSVKITHEIPITKVDKLAYYSVKCLRSGFDLFSGYTLGTYTGRLDEKQWLKRIIFLETVAGVPGMVGAMVRHLGSLRKLKRDHGWIHTLLEEAENERMHLMTAMRVANPGILMKSCIVLAQGVFVSGFSLAYFISPRFCHRFVGYLEEEAVKTYTHCLKAIDSGELKMWSRMKAPEIAVEYWKLPEDAMMREVILAIRADEAHHRTVNHNLGSKKPDEQNPYPPGQ